VVTCCRSYADAVVALVLLLLLVVVWVVCDDGTACE